MNIPPHRLTDPTPHPARLPREEAPLPSLRVAAATLAGFVACVSLLGFPVRAGEAAQARESYVAETQWVEGQELRSQVYHVLAGESPDPLVHLDASLATEARLLAAEVGELVRAAGPSEEARRAVLESYRLPGGSVSSQLRDHTYASVLLDTDLDCSCTALQPDVVEAALVLTRPDSPRAQALLAPVDTALPLPPASTDHTRSWQGLGLAALLGLAAGSLGRASRRSTPSVALPPSSREELLAELRTWRAELHALPASPGREEALERADELVALLATRAVEPRPAHLLTDADERLCALTAALDLAELQLRGISPS